MMLFKIEGLKQGKKIVAIDSSTFDSTILEKERALNDNLLQSNKPTQREASLDFQKSDGSLYDNETWVSTLGTNGQIGVYKIERKDEHDEFDYYLFVKVDQSKASKELYLENLKMKKQNQQTLQEFMDSPKYKYLLSVNERNAARLAHKASVIMGIHIESETDKYAFIKHQSIKPPLMGKPIISLTYNTFNSGMILKMQPFTFGILGKSLCVTLSPLVI